MTALQKHIEETRALVASFRVISNKAPDRFDSSALVPTATATATFIGDSEVSRNQLRYSRYRGWLYSAVSKLAEEGAGQGVNVGHLLGASPNPEERVARLENKRYLQRNMLAGARTKAADQELEVVPDHPLLDALENPNPIQGRWQFVHNFIVNLNLTGWAYVIGGESEDGDLEFYVLPTTWVRPDHRDGPFSRIKVINPREPSSSDKGVILERGQFAFSYMPDPSAPLAALPPAQSQLSAQKIDDHIQTSQELFFNQGVFPSIVITIGRDPHPDVPGGVRPRLTGPQRRQVKNVIRQTMGGVQNYGEAAIIDGMVEKIERLSATQNEMGWEKSEDKIKARILSAFAIHPFILGEAVNVGGYAQAKVITDRFCSRVNTFLDMLGTMMTNFAGPMVDESERTLVWWDKCEYTDPQIRSLNLREARKLGDITENEFRAELGFPPNEEERIDKEKWARMMQIISSTNRGELVPEAAVDVLVNFLGVEEDMARRMVGGRSEDQVLQDATEALQEAMVSLRNTPKHLQQLLEKVEG